MLNDDTYDEIRAQIFPIVLEQCLDLAADQFAMDRDEASAALLNAANGDGESQFDKLLDGALRQVMSQNPQLISDSAEGA